MPTDAKSQVYVIQLKSVNFAWRAKKDDYKGIANELGVKVAKDTDDNLVFGSNRPRPVKVRINLANKKSRIRYADPAKIEDLIIKGTLNGKKFEGQNINSVTVVQQ
jgi:CxxC motif-containing protein